MSKTLIIYYSLEGNIDFVAHALAKELNADTFRLETVKAYPKKGLFKYFHGGKDVVSNACPELKAIPNNLQSYDQIVIGTPVWASRAAAPINTLLTQLDFSGKRVSAFASSASGSHGKTFESIAAKLKNATISHTASFKNPVKDTETALKTVKTFAQTLAQ